MSEVVKCRRCRKLFRYLVRGYCADCLEARERDYETVRDYLREHPSARLPGVAEDTGVEAATIMEFVTEGRLEFSSLSSDMNAEKERRQKLAEQLAGKAPAGPPKPASGTLPSAPSSTGPRHGMATRRY